MSARASLTERLERFWNRVDTSGDSDACWLWLGRTSTGGYGQARTIPQLDGAPRHRSIHAHRQAWMIEHGNPGTFVSPRTGKVMPMVIRHQCPEGPNRLCCNPRHLKPGTSQDNTTDMLAAGREARGERAAAAKLTEDDVRAIRELHGAGRTFTSLGAEFGVSNVTASNIVRRKWWAHVK